MNTITISHVNVRQSIAFMLLRLLTIEGILDSGIVILLFPVFIMQTVPFISLLLPFQPPLLLVLISLKAFLTLFVMLEWLNEYYEIRPDQIIYRKGIIFRTEEVFSFGHVSSIGIDQGLFGKLCNFGTFTLYNEREKLYHYLYYIHNPQRYFQIVSSLLPARDQEKHTIRDHMYDIEEPLVVPTM